MANKAHSDSDLFFGLILKVWYIYNINSVILFDYDHILWSKIE